MLYKIYNQHKYQHNPTKYKINKYFAIFTIHFIGKQVNIPTELIDPNPLTLLKAAATTNYCTEAGRLKCFVKNSNSNRYITIHIYVTKTDTE